jgi:hypothetical protein
MPSSAPGDLRLDCSINRFSAPRQGTNRFLGLTGVCRPLRGLGARPLATSRQLPATAIAYSGRCRSAFRREADQRPGLAAMRRHTSALQIGSENLGASAGASESGRLRRPQQYSLYNDTVTLSRRFSGKNLLSWPDAAAGCTALWMPEAEWRLGSLLRRVVVSNGNVPSVPQRPSRRGLSRRGPAEAHAWQGLDPKPGRGR